MCIYITSLSILPLIDTLIFFYILVIVTNAAKDMGTWECRYYIFDTLFSFPLDLY